MADPFDFGVTASEVKKHSPFDTRGAGSGLDDDLAGYIIEASAEVENLYGAIEIEVADLDGAKLEKAKIAIRQYALSRMLYRLRHTGESYKNAKREWAEFKETIRRRPNEISTATVQVYDNTSEGDEAPHFGEGYEF